jgi:hypothetical protein
MYDNNLLNALMKEVIAFLLRSISMITIYQICRFVNHDLLIFLLGTPNKKFLLPVLGKFVLRSSILP